MYILLDIDGVMLSAAPWRLPEMLDDGFVAFSDHAISALQKIVVETGASIVLTSSHKSSYDLLQWKKIFETRGILAAIDKLDDNVDYLSRKAEILKWINQTNTANFVILDDDKSLNGLPADLKKRLVLTSSIIGLNEEAALSAIAVLRKKFD